MVLGETEAEAIKNPNLLPLAFDKGSLGLHKGCFLLQRKHPLQERVVSVSH